MKRKILSITAIAIATVLIAISVSSVLAGTVVGGIRIEPHSPGYPMPIMLKSPATFYINTTSGADPTCDPHIFLVMTNSCYNGLTGDVTVDWPDGATPDLTIMLADWTEETDNSVKVPINDVDVGYTVASLQSHLATEESIWWAFEPFLGGASLTVDPQEFTVTLPSTSPRMLVYALGKECPGTGNFVRRVPPTKPGLIVPELATIALVAASFGAFGLYAVRRRKEP